VPENVSSDAATSSVQPHKHSSYFRAIRVYRQESAATYGMVRISCNHEISAGFLEFSQFNPMDRRARIKRGDLRIKLTDQ
jgi:hypothetical protein